MLGSGVASTTDASGTLDHLAIKIIFRAGRVVQQVKMFTDKPKLLSSIPGTHTAEDHKLLQVVL